LGFPKVAKVVQDVLRTKLTVGSTTKNHVKHLAWKKIEKAGGPSKYGIGTAAMIMAVQDIIEKEVTRQLKMPLTDHDAEFRLPATVSGDLKELVKKIPRWIAIQRGPDAIWMSTLKARPEHWRANGELKETIALQTLDKAEISHEVELFLKLNGFANLEDAIAKS
jgi:hypothetical protein